MSTLTPIPFHAGLAGLAPDKPVPLILRHADGTEETIETHHSLSEVQIEWFKAGSALNLLRSRS